MTPCAGIHSKCRSRKIALLLAANEAALKVRNVRFVSSGLAHSGGEDPV